MPGVPHDGDVHLVANIKAAWFKDPDGNIGLAAQVRVDTEGGGAPGGLSCDER